MTDLQRMFRRSELFALLEELEVPFTTHNIQNDGQTYHCSLCVLMDATDPRRQRLWDVADGTVTTATGGEVWISFRNMLGY